jgi:hypothetical protein
MNRKWKNRGIFAKFIAEIRRKTTEEIVLHAEDCGFRRVDILPLRHYIFPKSQKKRIIRPLFGGKPNEKICADTNGHRFFAAWMSR